MFEVRAQDTGKVWAKRPALGRACETADVAHIATGQHFTVVRVEAVYSTTEIKVALRPEVEMACAVLSSARSGFRQWFARSVTRGG